ncbi:hypothetical protein [Myxococcus qinghaiensis]|uniref:hypothetical protein n=1 Tax=Myxococcus qinghaiensis TaxID=2906758 RepID=UPI0020A7147E|nr:hypothetical protein [Myxococcus qinghaiensis]MCP3164669.1 hypothetical protein [Myxococcus qinghaiensis]
MRTSNGMWTTLTFPLQPQHLMARSLRTATLAGATGLAIANTVTLARLSRRLDSWQVRRRPPRVRALRALAVGANALGATAIGALSVGAVAIGALSIGAFAIGRLRGGDWRVARLRIQSLEVEQWTGPVNATTVATIPSRA